MPAPSLHGSQGGPRLLGGLSQLQAECSQPLLARSTGEAESTKAGLWAAWLGLLGCGQQKLVKAGHRPGLSFRGLRWGLGKRLLGHEEGAKSRTLLSSEVLRPHRASPPPGTPASRGCLIQWRELVGNCQRGGGLSLPFKDSSVTQLSPSPQKHGSGERGAKLHWTLPALWLLSEVVRDHPPPRIGGETQTSSPMADRKRPHCPKVPTSEPGGP